MTAFPDGQGLALADETEREDLASMPETDDRQPFGCLGYSDVPLDYMESNRDWADRNNEAVRWLADNHAAIRAALRASPSEQTDGAGREWKTTKEERANLRQANVGGQRGALLDDLETAMGLARESEARVVQLKSERNSLRRDLETALAKIEALKAERDEWQNHWRELLVTFNAAERRVEELTWDAQGACFHFFACGPGKHAVDECGQLVPAMADLARSSGFSSDPATNEEIAGIPPSSLRARSTQAEGRPSTQAEPHKDGAPPCPDPARYDRGECCGGRCTP